jgi:hypothetical protein
MKCATDNCHASADARRLEGYCSKCWDFVDYLRHQGHPGRNLPPLRSLQPVTNRDVGDSRGELVGAS